MALDHSARQWQSRSLVQRARARLTQDCGGSKTSKQEAVQARLARMQMAVCGLLGYDDPRVNPNGGRSRSATRSA